MRDDTFLVGGSYDTGQIAEDMHVSRIAAG